MLGLSPNTAYLILFLTTLPISFWVIWSDLKFMKIPNKAVIAMLAIFVVVGLMVIPFEVWLWRWTHFIVILIVGIVLNATIHFGAATRNMPPLPPRSSPSTRVRSGFFWCCSRR